MACAPFSLAEVGLDDEVGTRGSVIFQVWADGTSLYDSGVMNGSTATKTVNVNISGKQELSLVLTDAGDNRNSDHADWAEARITCSTPTTPDPEGTSSTGYLSDLAWSFLTNGWGTVELRPQQRRAGRCRRHHDYLERQNLREGTRRPRLFRNHLHAERSVLGVPIRHRARRRGRRERISGIPGLGRREPDSTTAES